MAGPVSPLSLALAGTAKAPPALGPANSQALLNAFTPVDPSSLPVIPMTQGVPGQAQAPGPGGLVVRDTPLAVAGGNAANKSPDQNTPDPLSWVLDMLDRPRRAVADTLSGFTDLAIDGASGKAAQKNIGADIGEIASGPFRGLFSTNANDQQTTSQLIERGVDRYGKNNDPNYKDTTNNVNPVLKGVAGFIGDVATDPLTYVGGPAIRGALDDGKALLTGAVKAAKDLGPAGPAAEDVAKLADKAAGGDPKAADTLDTLTSGAASDAAKEAAPPPTPVTKVTEQPYVSPSWTEDHQRLFDATQKNAEQLLAADTSKMTPEELKAHAKLLKTTTSDLDKLAKEKVKGAPAAPAAPEVSTPTTPEGQTAVLTHTDQPLAAPKAVWSDEQEQAYKRSAARLDKMDPAKPAYDKLAAEVDAMATARAAAHSAVDVPEAAVAAEAPTPAAAAPAKNETSPVEKPLSAQLTEPKSLGQSFRDTAIPKISPVDGKPQELSPGSYPKFMEGLNRIGAYADKQKISSLDALTQLSQKGVLSGLFGESFLKGLQKYGNADSLAKTLREVYKVAAGHGHLDTDLETKWAGAQTALTNAFKDVGLVPEDIQAARAKFRGQSIVPETASLETVLPMMRSGEKVSTGLVKHLEDGDLKTLAKGSFDRLREEKPGMGNTTANGAKSTGLDTAKGYAEYRNRTGTANQTIDLIEASKLAEARLKEVKNLGGAKRSAAIRAMVLGTDDRTGLLEGLTKLRDSSGVSHWITTRGDENAPSLAGSADQVLRILGSTPLGQRLIDKGLFNAGTPVAKTAVLEASVLAASGASREEILAALRSTQKWHREGTIPNFLAEGNKLGVVSHEFSNSSVRLLPGEVSAKNGTKGIYVKQDANSLGEQLADLIVSHADDLKALDRTNREAYALRFGTESRDVTTMGLSLIDELRANPRTLGSAVRGIAHPEVIVNAIDKAAGGIRDDAKAVSTEAIKAATPEPVQVAAQQNIKTVDALKREDTAAAQAAHQKASDAAAEPVQEALDATIDDGIASGALPDTAQIGTEAPTKEIPLSASITADSSGLDAQRAGQEAAAEAAAPEETFAASKWAAKDQTDWQRKIRGEPAGYPRMRARGQYVLSGAFSFMLKAGNMVRDGFSFESLDTEMRTQLAQFSNRYANLQQKLHSIDRQVTDKLKISDIVLEDALRGRDSAIDYRAQRYITDQILAHWMGVGGKADKDTLLAEPFLRAGASPQAIVKHLESSGIIPKELKFEDGELEALITGDGGQHGSFAGGLANLLLDKGVRIPDAYEFQTKMFGAVTTYATHAGIAADLRASGIAQGFISEVPAAGMRRVVITNDTIFGHFINGKALYADPETAGAIMRMNELLDPKSKSAGELAHILQIFDDAQQLWKWGEVAIRPGTRVHNYVSDNLMTWMAMGHKGFRSSYARSLKVMMANRGEGGLSQDELIRGIQRVGGNVKDQTFGGSRETVLSGKHGSYSNEQTWRLFNKAGLATSAKAIERTDKENLSGVGNFSQRIYNSPVGRAASLTTEATENQVRLTHFIMAADRALQTGKVTTRWGKQVSVLGKDGKLDEELLAHTLGDAVRRYHPDPHMLTQFERNTIRRVLPFYSWNRSAVPAILDAMFMHPGRGLVFNKMSFAVGQSLGVQGNNLADPFPNGMWPGFLTGQMQGPQLDINGSMFMANPGIPTWDVANMFTDPNNVSGSVSPLLAMPLTMMTGKDFRTGQPITNPYDAIDQQLPIVANIEGGTGTSVTGSLIGLLTGNGLQKTSAGAQQAIEPGQGKLAMLNYLLGTQAMHANKDSYLKAGIAQQQQRLTNIMAGTSPSLGVGG